MDAHGGLLVLGRHDTLKHILLRDRSQHHGGPGGDEGDDVTRGGLGQKIEFAVRRRVLNDFVEPAGHAAHQPGDVADAGHDDGHLKEIGQRHRPHAAEQGVEQDDGRADDDAGVVVDLAAREDVEHQPMRGHLRRDPAQVREDDAQAGGDLHHMIVAALVKVADGEELHAIERLREKQTHQDQAQAGTERISDDAVHAFFEEGRGNPQHGFRSEPGGEHGCGHNVNG